MGEDIKHSDFLKYLDEQTTQINHLSQTLQEFRNFFRPKYELESTSYKIQIDSVLLLLKDILAKNNGGNVVRGEGMILNGKDNLIHSQNHFTAVVGLENVVIVHTDDATLVVHKDQVEEVKSMVDLIAESNREDLL